MGRPPLKHQGASAQKVDPSELQIDWEKVEKASAMPLAQETRAKIRIATLSFLDRVVFEQAAEPRRDRAISKKGSVAAKAIADVRATAAQLAHLVATNLHNERGADACLLIAVNFNQLLGIENGPASPHTEGARQSIFAPVDALIEMIGELVRACDKASTELAQLESVASDYWKDGAAWNAWVCSLAVILEESGVSATTRASDEGELTPFVRLVGAIEGFLPDSCSKVHKTTSLPKAVQRALRPPV